MIHPEKISLLERTHRAAHEFASSVPQNLVTLKPDAIAFSVNEIVHHLTDVERLWHKRFEQMMYDDGVQFKAMDPDALAKENRYNEHLINDGLNKWSTLRAKTLEMICAMDETIHHRRAHHPRYGEMDMSRILDIMANHDMQHLEQMKRTLAQVSSKK